MRMFIQNERGRLVGLLLVGLVLVGSAWWLFENAVQGLLENNSKVTANEWADYLAVAIPNIDDLLRGAEPSVAAIDFLAKTQNIGSVFSYRIFDANGRVRLDGTNASNGAVPLPDDDDAVEALEAMRSGNILLRTGKGDGMDEPVQFAQAYVPLQINGRIAGAIEVFVDETDEASAIRNGFFWAAAGIAGLTALGFLLPMGAYLLKSREAHETITFVARHDELTQLHNRAAFKALIDTQIAKSRADGSAFEVFFVDLDKFKNVNDSRGHASGDEVLRQVASRLRGIAGPRGEVCRLGGDEFAIFEPVEPGPERTNLGDRIVAALTSPIDVEGRQVEIGASVGISCFPRHGSTSEALLKAADIALYRAKELGRGRSVRFETSMEEQIQHRLALEARLRVAVARDEFEIYYQPLVDADKLAGFEALLRLKGEDDEPISPTTFIPVAEQIGLIGAIGKMALNAACRTAALWPSDLKVAVNLSSLQFESGDLVQTVKTALEATGLPAHRLELEVTESVLVSDTTSVLRQLNELKVLGVSVALDDFGTGYSSLSYLWMFPFDRLKVDRAFVNRLSGEDVKSRDVLISILALGRSLEMSITAEGVETTEQSAILRTLKVDTIQGYLYGKPVPETEVGATILKLRAGFENTGAPTVSEVAPNSNALAARA